MTNSINQEISNKIILIYWKMGQGKSVLAIVICILDFRERIYWNLNIYNIEWKLINKEIKDKYDIEKIRFSYTQWLIVIDEGGINMNSRNSSSDINKFLSEVIFLSRKKNASMLFIAQSFENIDINVKRLADLIIKVKKIRREWKICFILSFQYFRWWHSRPETYKQMLIKSIDILEAKKVKYNTLESSKINFTEKETKNLTKNKKKTILKK